MAVTVEYSAEYTLGYITPGGKNSFNNYGSQGRFKFTFTQGAAAGDQGSQQYLIKVPPGRWTVYVPSCYNQWSAFGASRTLTLGYGAYTSPDGTAVTADVDGLCLAVDVSSAGQAYMLGDGIAAGGGRTIEFTSRSGVDLLTTLTGTGTIPAAAKISGFFVLAGGGN